MDVIYELPEDNSSDKGSIDLQLNDSASAHSTSSEAKATGGGTMDRLKSWYGSLRGKKRVPVQLNARGEYETASLDRATSRKGKIRRHTVGGSGIAGDIMRAEEEVKLKQRDALFDHLAQRYPQHSNTIQGYHQRVPDPAMEVRPSSVQMQRRMVAQDQRQHYGYEEEDDGIMSEAETEATGNFRRGGFVRSSLPMRSPRGERPPALVFLVFNGATKRALLPPELAHLDTIKALFARSFGDQLNMKMLENPRKKIFVMDPNSNYYRPLEDVRDIRDRCVLKLHDLDSKDTLQTKPVYYGNRNYEDPSYYSEPEYDSGVSHMRRPPTKSPTYHGYPPQQVPGQSRTLPPPSEYMSHDEIQRMFLQQQVVAGRPPGRGPTPTGQWEGQRGRTTPTSQPYGPPQRPPPSPGPHQGYPPPASRQMAAQSLPTTPIMQRDPRTMNYNNAYQSGTRSGNVTPTPGNDPGTRMQMAKMEAQLANLTALVHNVVSRPGSAAGSLTGSHNSGSASKSTQYSPTPSSSVSSLQGISGGSTSTPQPEMSSEVQDSIRGLQAKAKELKTECRNLRRIQEAQADNIRDTIREAFEKIKDAMTGVPGASGHPLRARRSRADVHCDTFKQDCKRVENELGDLESSVEELRSDVINRRCRVNMADVESMALALSHISKALGELKGGFPVLQDELKTVMTAEMEVVVKEEKYLKDEPERLESALKKCKKLTGTLFTLKRLASVQEHRTPVVPQLMTMTVGEDEKKALFENIQHMIPNHDARMLSIEASENSRERKKKLVTSHEVRKFEKSLELASRALREKREKEVEEEDARKKLEGDSGIMNDMSNTSDPMQPERDGSETDTMKRRKALRELSPEKETSIDDDLEKPQSSSHAPPLAPPSLAQSQQSAFKRVIPGGGYIVPATLKLPARGPLAGSYQVVSQVAVQSVTEKQQIAVTQVAHSHTLPREQKSKEPSEQDKSISDQNQQQAKSFGSAHDDIPMMDDENGAEKDDESPVRDENYVKGQGEGQKGASGQVDVKTSNQEPAPSSGRSKFQQDIAQGIQASLNRPDLQEQKPRPEEPVQPHQDQVTPLKEPKEGGSKGDTEDVSSPCPGTPESPETVKKAPAPATAPQRVSLVRQPMMDQRPEMLRTKSFQLQEQYLKLQQLQREHALRQKDHTPTPSPPQSQQSGYSQLPQAAFVRQGSLRGHYELSPEGQPTRQAPYQDKPVQNGAFVRTGSLRGPHPQYSMPHPQGTVEAGNFNRQGSFKGHQENPSGSRGVPQLHPQQQQQYSGKQGVTPPPNPQQQPVMHQHQQQRQHSQSHVPAEKGQHSHGHSQHHHQQHHQQQHVPQHHHQQQQHHHHQSQQQKPQQHFNQGADKTPALNGEAKSHATQSQSQLPHSQPQSTASQPKSQPATQSTSHLTQSKPLPSAQSQLSRPDQNKRPPQAAPVSFGHQTTV